MNWKEVKEKYPKVYQSLLTESEGYIYNEFLYKFFDDNQIFIMINFSKLLTWGWMIDIRDGFPLYCGGNGFPYSNREEAEEAAFNKAFSILERRLNERASK